MEQHAPALDLSASPLDASDIQGIVLQERPTPYLGAYFLLRIDDPSDGRQMLQRLLPHVTSAAHWHSPNDGAWLTVALTFAGLQRLGVPQASLDTFSPEFRAGMASRAEKLNDTEESSPAHWERPLGTSDVHVALAVFAPDAPTLETVLVAARAARQALPGVTVVYRQDVGMLPTGRTHLGYQDGISNPVIAGSGRTPLPGQSVIKAGEFLFGYHDESGAMPPMPQPEALGRNGSYLAFRKLHMRVATFRSYLHTAATDAADEALLAAKMVGRWPSGAPLVLAPTKDEPALGADPQRRSNFGYAADDPNGLKCPVGAHIRRAFPRDELGDLAANVNIHRMLRRGTVYGPPLPDGVLTDDGIDRGIVFSWLGASLSRQFEFVKSTWLESSIFNGLGDEKDPIAGNNDGSGTFTIPHSPIRRRLHDLPAFTITRGGEYCFVPSMHGLRWLADGEYVATGSSGSEH